MSSADQLDVRRPEPELMDEADQAAAYAGADFGEPHDSFVGLIGERLVGLRRRARFDVVDLGCGSADITTRLARTYQAAHFVGIDGAAEMLAHAHRRVRAERLTRRVELQQVRLPDAGWCEPRFDLVVSNSLLHHLADPLVLWRTAQACLRPGGSVFVMDLRRPTDVTTATDLVARYASNEPALLRRDFHASLLAAYRVDEVAEQLRAVDWPLEVEEWGDRHLLVWGRA
jgi:2-polyprenyl-3-methyl-5-hydroxy-6-metoxy-1,4-benzoquinol methylase